MAENQSPGLQHQARGKDQHYWGRPPRCLCLAQRKTWICLMLSLSLYLLSISVHTETPPKRCFMLWVKSVVSLGLVFSFKSLLKNWEQILWRLLIAYSFEEQFVLYFFLRSPSLNCQSQSTFKDSRQVNESKTTRFTQLTVCESLTINLFCDFAVRCH